jgi:hypothetical protein
MYTGQYNVAKAITFIVYGWENGKHGKHGITTQWYILPMAFLIEYSSWKTELMSTEDTVAQNYLVSFFKQTLLLAPRGHHQARLRFFLTQYFSRIFNLSRHYERKTFIYSY